MAMLKKQIARARNKKQNPVAQRLYRDLQRLTDKTPQLLFIVGDIEQSVQSLLDGVNAVYATWYWLSLILVFGTLLIVPVIFFIFSELSWIQAAGTTLGVIVLVWLSVNVGTYALQKHLLHKARRTFLDMFAASPSSYRRALHLLQAGWHDRWKLGIFRVSRELFIHLNHEQPVLDDTELESRLHAILKETNAIFNLFSDIFALLIILSLIFLPIFLRDFGIWQKEAWWLRIIYLFGMSWAGAILIAKVITWLGVKARMSLTIKDIFEFAPRHHENYQRVLAILERLDASGERIGNGWHRVETRVHDALLDTPGRLRRIVTCVQHHPLSYMAMGMTIPIIVAGFWRFGTTWWMLLFALPEALIVHYLLKSLILFASRFHDGLALRVFSEERYTLHQSATGIFANAVFYISTYARIYHEIFSPYRQKARHRWQKKEWRSAGRAFDIARQTIETVFEKRDDPKIIEKIGRTVAELRQERADITLHLGMCQHLSEQLIAARATLTESLNMYQAIADSGQTETLEPLARIHAHLGICCCQLGDFTAATEHFAHSRTFYQDLRKKVRPSTGSGRAVGETPTLSFVRGEPVEPRCVSPVYVSSNSFKHECGIVEMWEAWAAYFAGETTDLTRLKLIEERLNALPMTMRQGHSELLDLAWLAQRLLAHHLLLVGSLHALRERYDAPPTAVPSYSENRDAWLANVLEIDDLVNELEDAALPSDSSFDSEEFMRMRETQKEARLYQSTAKERDYFEKHDKLLDAVTRRLRLRFLEWFVTPKGLWCTSQEYSLLQADYPDNISLIEAMRVDIREYISTHHPDHLNELEELLAAGSFEDIMYFDTAKLSWPQKIQLIQAGVIERLKEGRLADLFIDTSWRGVKKIMDWQQDPIHLWNTIFLKTQYAQDDDVAPNFETLIEEYERQIAAGHVALRNELLTASLAFAAALLKTSDPNVTQIDSLMSDLWELLQTMHADGHLSQAMIFSAAAAAEWWTYPRRRAAIGPNQQDASRRRALTIAETTMTWLDQIMAHVLGPAQAQLAEAHVRLHQIAVTAARELQQFERAYLLLERGKTRVLADLLADQLHDDSLESGEHVPQALREQRHKLLQELKAEWAQNLSSEDLQILREKKRALAGIDAKISNLDPAFAAITQPQPLTRRDFSPQLADDELALAFEQDEACLWMYPITKWRGVHAPTRVNISAKDVQARVNDFHHGLAKGGELDCASAAWEIHAWLTETLGHHVKAIIADLQPRQIIFVPHRAWHLLPLHLIGFAEDEPIIKHFPARYLPSLQILCLLRRKPSQTGAGCIIVNPDDARPSLIKQGQAINAIRPEDTCLFIGRNAMREDALNALQTARNAHFACHGVFEPDLKSRLILAQYPSQNQEITLSARELFTTVRFNNQPRLAVLSACETAQIQETETDEYMGLASGFLYAGAHNVIASLWPVEAEATQILMEYFYRNVEEGRLSLPDSLKHAQEQLRDHSGKYKHNPYYWAGFILIGEESGQACEGVNPSQG